MHTDAEVIQVIWKQRDSVCEEEAETGLSDFAGFSEWIWKIWEASFVQILNFVDKAPHVFGMVILPNNSYHLYLTVLLQSFSPPCHACCPCVFRLSVFLQHLCACIFLSLCVHFPLCKFYAKKLLLYFQAFLICKTNNGEQSWVLVS